ncbi:MAG: trypsin-like peptidase domain-containing protein [Gammaproteobacteria bacterium]|nr:trypsin-like peptidase domain-containing protein [Gammaproteobacteria bacterium]MCP5137040.1 trypsin-like peptidase domain-containing protein [Gammaproteobacteria bacterium]
MTVRFDTVPLAKFSPNRGLTQLAIGHVFIAFLLMLADVASAALPPLVDGEPLPSLAPMVEKVVPAVVNIRALAPADVPPPGDAQAYRLPSEAENLGSGVVIDAEAGYVVTNRHVIDGAHSVQVMLSDGRRLEATRVGVDPATDLAVIRIPADALQGLPMFDSDALRVGDFVVAIGNAFGLSHTVTSGIVSGLGRSGLGYDSFEDFIQTDASVNPGNSGGALVNLRGELVGINTAILAPGGNASGVSFAIPIKLVRAVVEQIVEHGEVRRGELGAQMQDLTRELAAAYRIPAGSGAVLTRITPRSAADKAGLQAGDLVLEIDGHPVRDANDLRNRVGLVRVGDVMELGLMRNGNRLTSRVRMRDPQLHSIDGERLTALLAGAQLSEVETERQGFRGGKQVQVMNVESGSRAQRAGLLQGDVIDTVERQGIDTLADLMKATSRAGDALRIRVRRGNDSKILMFR